MPITNKNIIQESKVLSAVERMDRETKERVSQLETEAKSLREKLEIETTAQQVKPEPSIKQEPSVPSMPQDIEAENTPAEDCKSETVTVRQEPQGATDDTAESDHTGIASEQPPPPPAPPSDNTTPQPVDEVASQAATVDSEVTELVREIVNDLTQRVCDSIPSNCNPSELSSADDSSNSQPASDLMSKPLHSAAAATASAEVTADEDSQDDCMSQDESSQAGDIPPAVKTEDSLRERIEKIEGDIEDLKHLLNIITELLELWALLKVRRDHIYQISMLPVPKAVYIDPNRKAIILFMHPFN